MNKYPVTVRFRTTPRNAKALERLAAFYARSEADVLRLLVDEAAWCLDQKKPKAIGTHSNGTPAPTDDEGLQEAHAVGSGRHAVASATR